MVKMEETVESKTLEHFVRDSVWPAAVSTAAVASIPEEANQMPVPLEFRPFTVTCLLYNLWDEIRFVDVIRLGWDTLR